MKTKTCTHCGELTHPQPQDFNHDTGYGHCYSCLANPKWYLPNYYTLPNEFTLAIWEERNSLAEPLTMDDSHAKIIELSKNKQLYCHYTSYEPKPTIITTLIKKFC